MKAAGAAIAGLPLSSEIRTLIWILAALVLCGGAFALVLWRRKARLDRLRRWADENHYAILQIDEIPGLWSILQVLTFFTGTIGRSGLRVRVEDEEGGLAEFEITFRLRRMDIRRV